MKDIKNLVKPNRLSDFDLMEVEKAKVIGSIIGVVLTAIIAGIFIRRNK